MSEENLVRQCAPTLAGIKTGTIFPAPFTSLAELTAEIRELNRILVPKGLRLLPLRYQDHTALLYLYRPAELREDLKDQLAEALLADAGYSGKSSEQCVAYLAKRFRSGGRISPRGRAVSQLSASGCSGLHRKSRRQLQVRRSLEGLR